MTNSTVHESAPPKKAFVRGDLVRFNDRKLEDFIIMVTTPESHGSFGGTIVYTDKSSNYTLGTSGSAWKTSSFELFHGAITLESD